MKNPIFTTGEVVIALTDPRNDSCQFRTRGKEYKVMAVKYCSSCGSQQVNLGLFAGTTTHMKCSCGSVESHHGLKWTHSRHFVRKKDLQKAIEECCEEENYELAAVLRDVK